MTTASQARTRVPNPGLLILAAGLGAASLLMTRGYDELFWSAVVRDLANGAVLYDTILDNKGPLWYPIFALLEVVPVPFEIARALGIMVALAFQATLGRAILLRNGIGERAARFAVGAAIVSVAFLSYFHFTIELVTGIFVLGSIHQLKTNRYLAASAFLAGLLIDPRVVVLAPGIVAMGYLGNVSGERWQATAKKLWPMASVALLGIAVYFVVPGLRFSVIEVGRATRLLIPYSVTSSLTILVASLLPVAVSYQVLKRHFGLKLTRSALVFAAGAVALAVVSQHPFPHYYAYAAITLFFVLRKDSPEAQLGPFSIAMLALSLIPVALLAADRNVREAALNESYNSAFVTLEPLLGREDSIVVFSSSPNTAARFPSEVIGNSPVTQPPLGLDTSREDELVDQFDTDLTNADWVWVEADTPPDELVPSAGLEEPHRVLISHLSDFPCRLVVPPLFVYGRLGSSICP